MSLLLHRFFGAANSSGPSGYYYEMLTIVQNYSPEFSGARPVAGGGWVIAGSRPNDIRFIATLSATGVLTSYKQNNTPDFQPNIHMMSERNQFSDGRMSVALHTKIGYLSTSQNYTGTPCVFSAGLSIICNDDATNTVFSTHLTGGGYSPSVVHISSVNSSGTTNWVKNYTVNPWYFPSKGFIRGGDTTNCWLSAGALSATKLGLLAFNKSTGALSSAFAFSLTSLGNTAASFISDSSGNLFLGTLNGQVVRVNADNTVAWAFSYTLGGQNFGYTYICLYNGFLYGISTQHPNGNYLFKMNPADGAIVWCINMSVPFNSCKGISASVDGIIVAGQGSTVNGFQPSYLLNYPLDAGITGTKGAFSFAVGTVVSSAISTTFTSQSVPTLATSAAGSASTYAATLAATASIMGSRIAI